MLLHRFLECPTATPAVRGQGPKSEKRSPVGEARRSRAGGAAVAHRGGASQRALDAGRRGWHRHDGRGGRRAASRGPWTPSARRRRRRRVLDRARPAGSLARPVAGGVDGGGRSRFRSRRARAGNATHLTGVLIKLKRARRHQDCRASSLTCRPSANSIGCDASKSSNCSRYRTSVARSQYRP